MKKIMMQSPPPERLSACGDRRIRQGRGEKNIEADEDDMQEADEEAEEEEKKRETTSLQTRRRSVKAKQRPSIDVHTMLVR